MIVKLNQSSLRRQFSFLTWNYLWRLWAPLVSPTAVSAPDTTWNHRNALYFHVHARVIKFFVVNISNSFKVLWLNFNIRFTYRMDWIYKFYVGNGSTLKLTVKDNMFSNFIIHWRTSMAQWLLATPKRVSLDSITVGNLENEHS